MTIEEIVASDKAFLTAAEAASVLGCNAQAIRIAARTKPELLGFPVIQIGSRTKISRIPFLKLLGYVDA